MANSFGSTRLVVGAHYGLRDWLAQRFTSLVMAVFTLVLSVQLLLAGPVDYYTWAAIFSHQWMKVLAFVVVISLVWHVWVGMRDIWMDYVQNVGIRLTLQVLTIVWLVGCGGWAVQVLWRF